MTNLPVGSGAVLCSTPTAVSSADMTAAKLGADRIRYQLVYSATRDGQVSPTPVGIRCLRCGRVSYNLNDVRERYCGACHRFHDDTGEQPCRVAR